LQQPVIKVTARLKSFVYTQYSTFQGLYHPCLTKLEKEIAMDILKYLCRFKMVLGFPSGTKSGLFDDKTKGKKSRAIVFLKNY
jgi:hypothetical protein